MFERKAYTVLMVKYRCNSPISSFYNFTKSTHIDLISDFLALRENYNRYSTVYQMYCESDCVPGLRPKRFRA